MFSSYCYPDSDELNHYLQLLVSRFHGGKKGQINMFSYIYVARPNIMGGGQIFVNFSLARKYHDMTNLKKN